MIADPNQGETVTPSVVIETDVIVCVACPEWRGTSVAQAIGHEHNRHDGAQTCWWRSEQNAAMDTRQ